MLKRVTFLLLLTVSFTANAKLGLGLFVGEPYWGVEMKYNAYRFNFSLEDNLGFGMNRVYGVSNTPLYLYLGGQYVDRSSKSIALTPGLGAQMSASNVDFYVDVGPSLYLDGIELDWEAKLGFRVNF
ncbi:hypothetical protein [Thaumasiovibrio sp. DFM-14]|uniref:hypothetical protein n=1 Tax=Thaumasiovibrio sp. DFM-14 TaxID=3384792 RepID=UPI0039A06E3B